MDPLSISASVAGLITITDTIAGKSYKYIKEARGASKEVKKLLEEITDLFGILNSLRLVASRYEDEAFKSTMQSQHIHACHILLETIKGRLDKADPSQVDEKKSPIRYKTSTLGRSLVWPFTSTETKALIAEVANHKSTMSLALAADGMTALLQALSQQQAQSDDIREIRDNLRTQRAEQALSLLSRERRMILDTVGTYDPSRHQDIAIKLRQPGTGVWFTEGLQFTNWLATSNAKLWLYGIPGAGKTVLTSSIIQAATNQLDQSNGIAYFYCDYKDPETHDPLVILGALVKQLAIQDERCMAELEEFYKRNCPEPGSATTITSDGLCSLLKKFSVYYEDVLVIIDALDECGRERSHVVELLASLNANGKSNIKTLFTSRLETDIEIHLQDYEKISIAATSSDLKLYVAAEIENRSRKKALRTRDPELKNEIMDRLIEGAEGMFRWVACQLDYLCELNTDKALRRALHSLPPTLFATYERILDRVNASNCDTQELVQRVLMWIVCSKRPLSTKELLEAVSINEGDGELDQDAMPDEEGILKWCSSLVRRTPDGERLELAHFTVEEFLLAIDASDPKSQYVRYRVSKGTQDLLLAKICLTYLEFDDFDSAIWSGKEDFNNCIEEYPFFDYASTFWFHHAGNFHEDEALLELVQVLYDPSKSNNFVHWSHFWTWTRTSDDTIIRTSNAETLHFAAIFSLYSTCEWLIKEKDCIGNVDKLSNIGTPLCCAIGGQEFFRDAVIPPNYPTNSPFLEDETSYKDSKLRTIECLLDAGAAVDNIRVHPDYDWSPLALALRVDFGWEVLIKRGAILDETCLKMVEEDLIEDEPRLAERFILSVTDRNLSDDIRSSYINIALKMKETRQQAVNMMARADDGSKNMPTNHNSALGRAAMIGQVRVVKELLEKPAIEVDFRDPDAGGSTALHLACENGHLDIIKLFLDHSANIDTLDDEERTPFHLAAGAKDVDVVKFMADHGADINKLTMEHLTSIHLAAKGNSVLILEYLLSSPKNTHTLTEKTRNGRTALLCAVEEGSVETAKFIIGRSNASDLLVRTVDGYTCLHLAAKSGKSKMMSLFRKSGISHLERTSEGLTALHFAAKGTNDALLRELLDQINEATLQTSNPFAQRTIVDSSMLLQNRYGAWCLDSFGSQRQLDITSGSGRTALQFLISADPFTTETLLMFQDLTSRAGIDLEHRDKEKRTPIISLASRYANTSTAEDAYHLGSAISVLLKMGVDANAQDVAGCTALHYLCRAISFTHPLFVTIGDFIDVQWTADLTTGPPPPPPPPLGAKPPVITITGGTTGGIPPPPRPLSPSPSSEPLTSLEDGSDELENFPVAQVDILDKSKETALQAFFRGIHRIYNRHLATDLALRFLSLASKDHLRRYLPDGDLLLNLAIVAMNDKVIKELHKLNIGTQNRDRTREFRSPLELLCIYGATDVEVLRDIISQCKDLSELDFEGQSLLHLACLKGNVNVVQELLNGGINVNIESRGRTTPIAEAVAGGHTSIVELLLDHHASVEVGRSGGRGWKACLLNRVPNINICRLLDDRGVNDWTERTSCAFQSSFVPSFSTRTRGKSYDTWVSVLVHRLTPLHHLAFTNHLDVFKYVLEHVENIDFNVHAQLGTTPLFFAILGHNQALVKFLVSNGARTDALYTPRKWSMLHLAAFLGNITIVEELLSHGADACATDISGLRPSLLALQNQKLHLIQLLEDAEKSQSKLRNISLREIENEIISPAMTDAVGRGDLALCRRLVERGFTIDGPCQCGCTLVLYACVNQAWEVALYLMDVGASIEGVSCERHPVTRGFSAVHYAACFGHENLLKELLDRNASISGDLKNSVDSIHLASYNGNLKIIQILLGHTKDPKTLVQAQMDNVDAGVRKLVAKGYRGWRVGEPFKGGYPLLLAAANGHTETVELLLRTGADLEARDESGMTALQHSISVHVDTDTFELLVGAGANLNTRDFQGTTPFIRAAQRGLTKFLTKMKTFNQLDIHARDSAGEDALRHAIQLSDMTAADMLVDMGLDVNAVDDMGYSSIQAAISYDNSKFALEKLPSTDLLRDSIFGSILNEAALTRNNDIAAELLKRTPSTELYAYLNFPCRQGTPLYAAAIHGYIPSMELFLDNGAEINLVGGALGTPLMAACTMGSVAAVALLLRKGAELECIRPDGATTTARDAAKQHDQVLWVLEKFETDGIDSLDNPPPSKEANIEKMEEVLATLRARKPRSLDAPGGGYSSFSDD